MKLTNKGILDAQAATMEANRLLRMAIYRAVRRCSHRTVGEAPYFRGYDSILPPFRVCLNCGLHEENLGYGNTVLTNAGRVVTSVSRDEGFALATVRIDEKDKSLLRRGEASIHQIVYEKLSLVPHRKPRVTGAKLGRPTSAKPQPSPVS